MPRCPPYFLPVSAASSLKPYAEGFMVCFMLVNSAFSCQVERGGVDYVSDVR